MTGYTYREHPDSGKDLPGLTRWEELAANAVGHVIEFWGFKRNHGRIWCLLYLRDEAMASTQLQQALDLSKGAVSMIARDLETWNVIRRVRKSDSRAWHFVAEVNFLKMVRQVFDKRELPMIERVHADLSEALDLARNDPDVDPATVRSLAEMVRLADVVIDALRFFLKTMRFDIAEADNILDSDA